MQHISFEAVPIPEHAFLEKTQLQRSLSHDFLQIARLTLQSCDLAERCLTSRIPGQALLALLSATQTDGVPSAVHEPLGPRVLQALGGSFEAAKLGDRALSSQAIYNDADLLFSTDLPPRLTLYFFDMFGHRSNRPCRRSHIHSNITMNRKPSLSKTADLSQRPSRGAGRRRAQVFEGQFRGVMSALS